MANLKTNRQTTEQIVRNIASVRASVEELESVLVLMKSRGISEIDTSHVGQMDRAVVYVLNYATSCKKAALKKIHESE